jgi:hypothetical protein
MENRIVEGVKFDIYIQMVVAMGKIKMLLCPSMSLRVIGQ